MSDVCIVTHSSRFHADDVYAVATLKLLLDDGRTSIEVVRSRDPEDIARGDYVVDVGGVYDASQKRFDHHQLEGAGEYDNGIPYAAFGLVWKEYGEQLTGSHAAAQIIEEKMTIPLDAMDNGVEIVDARFENVYPYSFASLVSAFNATWKEGDIDSDFHYDTMFTKAVDIAIQVLEREIMHARALVEGISKVEELYAQAEDKRIIIGEQNYPYQHVLHKYPEPLYIVRSNPQDDTWSVGAVRTDVMRYGNRKDFPKAWGGLRDEELQRVTGVEDAVFCHRKLFLAVAQSKEGALKLARLAVEA